MKLTIGLLVSNRIESVKKCLESMKPLLDRGIAELICVDTVSATEGLVSDGSAELARAYATKVVEFPWVRDFAKARNITLQNATGEWYLYVDDDEWFDSVDELVRFFESNEYKKYWSASYIIRNYSNKAGTEWSDVRAARLVKRTEQLHFEGRVHEALSELHLPCKELSIYAHHYGYAYDSEEEKVRHRERNMSLLIEEIKERPGELRLRAQLALEYANFDNDRALEYVREVLPEFESEQRVVYFQWMISLMFQLYEALGMSTDKLTELYREVHEKYEILEFAELAIRYSMAVQFLIAQDPAGALPHMREYFKLYNELAKDDAKRQMQNTVDFEHYMSRENHSKMTEYREYAESVVKLTGSTETIEEKCERLERSSFEDFSAYVVERSLKVPSCFEDEELLALVEYFEKKSEIKYLYLLYKMSETEIRRAIENGADGRAISELFIECIQTERKMYELMYGAGLTDADEAEYMPVDVRYNAVLYEFIQGGCKHPKILIEAAKLRPEMAKVISAWVGALARG